MHKRVRVYRFWKFVPDLTRNWNLQSDSSETSPLLVKQESNKLYSWSMHSFFRFHIIVQICINLGSIVINSTAELGQAYLCKFVSSMPKVEADRKVVSFDGRRVKWWFGFMPGAGRSKMERAKVETKETWVFWQGLSNAWK